MNKEVHIENVTSGREVHFDKGSFYSVIHRFCPYCGSKNLEECKEWPRFLCLTCGLRHHEDDTQLGLEDFKRVQERLIELRKKRVEALKHEE